MLTVLTAEKLWDGTSMLDHPVVAIEGGRIASISSREASELPGVARVLDFPGATLAPSFFDVHIHGGAGHDAMEATPEALNAISSFLASATIIVVLRAPLGPSVRVRYHCASALSFWNIRKRHANWMSPRRTRALPALARPFSRRFKPLSSGDPVSPA